MIVHWLLGKRLWLWYWHFPVPRHFSLLEKAQVKTIFPEVVRQHQTLTKWNGFNTLTLISCWGSDTQYPYNDIDISLTKWHSINTMALVSRWLSIPVSVEFPPYLLQLHCGTCPRLAMVKVSLNLPLVLLSIWDERRKNKKKKMEGVGGRGGLSFCTSDKKKKFIAQTGPD